MNDELDCILVGVLAGPEDLPPFPGKSLVVFVNNINELQFSLKIISDSPEFLPANKAITCYANKFRDYDFDDDYYADYPTRARYFEEFIADKIVLFRPARQYKKGEILYSAEPVMVLPKPPQIHGGTRLIPMLFLNNKDDEDYKDLIINRQPVGPFRYFPGQMPVPDPVYVYIDGFLYGGFDAMQEKHGKWILSHRGRLRRAGCNFFEYEEIVTYRDVAFVEAGLYLEDFARLLESEGGEINVLPVAADGDNRDNQLSPGDHDYGYDHDHTAAGHDLTPVDKEVLPGAAADMNAADLAAAGKPEPDLKYNLDEVSFMHKLIKQCRSAGLIYDEDDLYNFHIDLKVNNFVVIAGMSGTGKSRLMSMYARALGLAQNHTGQRFVFIPVKPAWTDESDLLGFLDTSHHIYRPADTGLLNLLLAAEKNPDQLYLVCFDEMNLARPEHYFAQFLSVFELPEQERILQLYNPELEERIYNAHHYPARVKIGRNVLWLGTVNIDESTYSFSDKVLDRFSMLRLKMLPFMRLTELTAENPADSKTDADPAITASQYQEWIGEPGVGLSLTTSEINFLDQLHQQINLADAKKGVSYRSLRHIDQYLRNIPRDDKGPLLNRAKAFDYQLVQKVFPLLRGPQEQMHQLIGVYNETSDAVENSDLLKLMDEYSNISDFNYSRAEIKQKAKELRWFGYAS